MRLAAFTWRCSANYLRAVVDRLLGVKRALATGKALK
jgi:hypothetical protein